MSVFVLGSGGYIARRAIGKLRARNLPVVPLSSHPQHGELAFDLLTPQKFDFGRFGRGDFLLLAGGISSPERCRNQPDLAQAVNVTGTSLLTAAAIARDVSVIFFSSDAIYGNVQQPLDEDAAPEPFGEYAIMKRAIEARFSTELNFKTLRLSYVFSRTDKFTSYLSDCALHKRAAEIFHPLSRRVVYLEDLLDFLVVLCQDWANISARVINVGGPELLSRLDMASAYRQIVSPQLSIKMGEAPAGFFDARPPVVNMNCSRFEELLGRPSMGLRRAMSVEFEKGD